MPSSDKWKHFERLVAAIHRAADEGADVRWNDSINGRQFDITIRFKRGLYDYLTVVECKAFESPVSVEKVEAFVTKAADVHADRAVMASTSGFQSGAQAVALKHNMTLIHVTDSSDVDFSAFGAKVVDTIDALHIQSIVEYTDGERKILPEESHKQTYYVKQIRLRCGSEQATFDEIIEGQSSKMVGGKTGVYETHTVELPLDTVVTGRGDGEIPLKPLDRIHIRAGITRLPDLMARSN
jgi:Restriction endonuclease